MVYSSLLTVHSWNFDLCDLQNPPTPADARGSASRITVYRCSFVQQQQQQQLLLLLLGRLVGRLLLRRRLQLQLQLLKLMILAQAQLARVGRRGSSPYMKCYHVAHVPHESHQKSENYRIIFEQQSSNNSMLSSFCCFCAKKIYRWILLLGPLCPLHFFAGDELYCIFPNFALKTKKSSM